MPKLLFRMRDVALKRVEDFLEEFPNDPHTVRDICRLASVSERTLQYAFRERFGIPPKSYLLALRLNGVHRGLKNADPVSTKITDKDRKIKDYHTKKHRLIKKTKQPQGNFLSDSRLDIIYCQVRIRDAFYLFETFISAPNFECIAATNKKISAFGH